MPVVSAFFLAVALALAVIIGPQTRVWTWGPAMLSLGLSVMAALPVFWRRGRFQVDSGLLIFASMVVGWFAWRSQVSPVAELGLTDLLLLCSAVAGFTSIRAITGNAAAERVLIWGIALLLAASVAVVSIQLMDPTYAPVFNERAGDKMISGFAAHYNEAANYFIASSLLVGAAALLGRHHTAARIILLVMAAAGLACVYFTKSRGGILGAAVGCGMMIAMALVIAKRRNSKWFARSLISLPFIGMAVAAFLILGWEQRSGGNTAGLLDNDIRLYLMGIALSCIRHHPLAGGGSQSFSWESYRFFDSEIQRHGGARPEMAHNELLQSATDYGLTGAALLAGLLATLALLAILRIVFENRPRELDSRDAWRAGALAALAGMLVQSCFSFVFHPIPGVILLGICLGMLSRAEKEPPSPRTLVARSLLALSAVGCACLLLPTGWKGIRVTRTLWSTWFSKQIETSAESRIDSLAEAIRIWPLTDFYQARAEIFQKLALEAGPSAMAEPAERAIEDYSEAARLHAFEPSHRINRANLLSQLGRDDEAEADYALGIQLQGGMEPGFRGHYSLANHHLRKGLKAFGNDETETALSSLEIAAGEMERAVSMMHWVIRDMTEPRIVIHESLGTMREATGDLEGALEAYDFAAKLHQGKRVHYRAALLIGKKAVETWSQRQPSKALTFFMEARRRVGMAGGELPAGISQSQQVEYIAYLDRTIAFLKGAKVQPQD